MTRYFLLSLSQLAIPLFGLTIILFILLRVGGDPTVHLVSPEASPQEIQQVREAYGFDRPLLEQYIRGVWLIMRGDFGNSFRFRSPAMPLVLERLPATLSLAFAAIVVAILISIPAGLLSAIYQNSWLDFIVTIGSTLGRAMPNFWIGIMLILLFAVEFRWFPVSGRSGFASIILPAVTLGTGIATSITRILRSSMLEVLKQDYIRTARSKGQHALFVILRHGMRNALIPVVTVAGLQVAFLLGGTVVVEEVFAWPGLGRLILNSVRLRDLSVVQAGVLVYSLMVMLANLLVDLSYAYIDPRIRYS